jgi:N-acetylmuramoyl-L-alanine amidase
VFPIELATEIALQLLASAALGHVLTPTSFGITIIDRPIAFPPERAQLTLEYRRRHEDPNAQGIDIQPRMIVLHHTGGSTLEAAFTTFERVHLNPDRESLQRGGSVNVAAHFLVDRDGTIYRLMPETRMGRHTIGLNHLALGVENVGDRDRHPLTEAQVAANAGLIRYLVSRHAITHLIGHHEYRLMESHPYWMERDKTYRSNKPDPGVVFMARVRERIADLMLEGPPGGR